MFLKKKHQELLVWIYCSGMDANAQTAKAIYKNPDPHFYKDIHFLEGVDLVEEHTTFLGKGKKSWTLTLTGWFVARILYDIKKVLEPQESFISGGKQSEPEQKHEP